MKPRKLHYLKGKKYLCKPKNSVKEINGTKNWDKVNCRQCLQLKLAMDHEKKK